MTQLPPDDRPPDDRSSDDLPPEELSLHDRLLQLHLQKSFGQRFLERCDRSLQKLLAECQWAFTPHADVLTVEIHCPTLENYAQILDHTEQLGSSLIHLTNTAKIQIFSPSERATTIEIRCP
ncbi:MAG TPA: hypothetical protein IGS37_00545 [Synechococcales cyanobacterium M55_K2018_004]|nr:hypothetical protein [Synechococcales cyanobacterium M55_K2018_004]